MRLAVTQKLDDKMVSLIQNKLGNLCEIDFIHKADDSIRKESLVKADIVMAMNIKRDLKEEEFELIKNAKLIQITLAGADIIPFEKLSPHTVVCSNGGAYSDPIAEHAMGMMLSLARNFLPLHRSLSNGIFDQWTKHKLLKGSTLGIIGFGGIGKRTAELARGFGMKIFAINKTGKSDIHTDFIGTIDDLDYLLKNSDFILLSIALNKHTKKIIGKRELELMKPDAVLINVARGDLVDEGALYNHLKANPQFKAGIEAWWIEPFNYPKFEIHYPFFELDNFLGSPHNSYLVDGIMMKALDAAVDNILAYIEQRPLKNIQNREDYI
ncbi:MAG: 2-hydroxyacid dehydrogenase [Candidatus Kryptoniota bacterium]